MFEEGQDRIDDQDSKTALLTEALKIIEEGLEDDVNASSVDMRAALGELEDHFGENTDFFDTILKGNVAVFRNELNNILEGAEDTDELKNMLEIIRDQLSGVLHQEAPEEPGIHDSSAQDSTHATGQNVQIMKQAIESRLGDFMKAVLEENGLYKPNSDPVSMALVTMFLDENLDLSDIDRLQTFLQKPNAFMPEEAIQYKDKSSDELKAMIANSDNDIQNFDDQISDNKEKGKYKGLSKDERTNYNKEYIDLLGQKRAINREKSALEFALQFKGGLRRYKSVEQIMYMSRIWLGNEHKESLPSELDIMIEMESKIDEARSLKDSAHARLMKKNLENVKNELTSAIHTGDKNKEAELTKEKMQLEKMLSDEVAGESWGILRPRLTLILETIAEKNAHLNKVGTDKLKSLAKCWGDKGKVEIWLDDLEGTEEYKMTKVVPPLIAYLQITVREKLASNVPVISGKHAEGLLQNLKIIRHEKAKKSVADKLGENATGVDAMTAYFAEIAKMTVNEQEITKEHMSRSPYWKLGGKGVKLGGKGIFYGGKYGGKSIIGIGGALFGLAKFGVRSAKKTTEWIQGWSDDTKQGVTRSALRGMCAGVLGAGVAMAGLATIPAAALIAMPAVFTPEFIKHREIIAKRGAQVAGVSGRTALYAGKLGILGLTGGLAVFSNRWRDSVKFKNF